MKFDKFDTFIFDLDGTIWCWERLYKNVKKVLKAIQSKNKQVIFVSNNTLLSRIGLVEKLNNFGIEADLNSLINSGYAVSIYLKNFGRKSKVLAFGNGLIEELKYNKIKLVRKPRVDFLVVGHDLEFNMKKLSIAYEALNFGAKFLGTARGKIFVTEKTELPGTGLIIELIENMSGKKAEILGKPSDFICNLIKQHVKFEIRKTIWVGDEVSDVISGKKIGCYTCLVKTGVYKGGKLDVKPDFIINSVGDMKI
jgi:HAD superfamily hydrolase (TIGR01450 family)